MAAACFSTASFHSESVSSRGGGASLSAWPGGPGDLPGLSQRYAGCHAEDCECAHVQSSSSLSKLQNILAARSKAGVQLYTLASQQPLDLRV